MLDRQTQSLCYQVNNISEKISQTSPEWFAKSVRTRVVVSVRSKFVCACVCVCDVRVEKFGPNGIYALWKARMRSTQSLRGLMMMMMLMMTIYRARTYPCCNSMLLALERPLSSSWLVLSLTVRAGYVCVAIIHQTLTWTTGSLLCAQMLMYAIANWTRTPKQSLH